MGSENGNPYPTAVRFYARLGASAAKLRAMLEDGRLERAEHLLEGVEARSSKTKRRLRRAYESEFAHLYVLEFVDVGTKVGISRNPARRLAVHEAAARLMGRSLGRAWVSVSHLEAHKNERALVRSEPGRTEVLSRSFDGVMALVDRLPVTTVAQLFAGWSPPPAPPSVTTLVERKPYFERYWEQVAALRAARPGFDPRAVMSRAELAEVSP